MPPRMHHPDAEEPQDYIERKPFRWGRFLVLSFLLLAIVLILGHWWWSRRGEKALLAQMAEYAKRGEPASFEDFQEEDIPDAMNAALDLRAAAAALALAGEDDRRRISETGPLPLNEKEVALLERFIRDNAKVFEHVQSARTKPAVNWRIKVQSPVVGMLLPDLNGQKEIANLLRSAALLAHQQGNDAAALAHVEDMRFVARCVGKQPFLVSYLVSIGIESLALDTLRQMAPNLRVAGGAAPSPGTPADRTRLQALIAGLLDDAPARAGFRRAMHAERLGQVDGTRLLARGDARFIESVAGGGGGGATMPLAVVAGVLRPIVYEDGVMMIRYTTAVAEAAMEETHPAARAKTPDYPMEAKRSLLHVNAQLFLPALDAVTERHYRMITERRATATTLAIRLFAADHQGRLPDRLEDLLPAYLPKVPIDPFSTTAGAIRYLAGGEPILYSVSSNGIDDAGSGADHRGQPAKYLWHGLDAVFHLTRQPRPAEEEEEDEPEPDLSPDLIEPEGTTQPAPAQESIEPAQQ